MPLNDSDLFAGIVDFRELFNERLRFETVVDLRFIALIDDIQFSQIFLKRQRFDRERHGGFVAGDMMLMPHALADIESVAGFPIDALAIQDAVSRATENNNNRFIVFVGHRMRMRRIDVTVDFDDTVVETQLLRAKAAKPNAIGWFLFHLDVFRLERLAPGFAFGRIRFSPIHPRLKKRTLALLP